MCAALYEVYAVEAGVGIRGEGRVDEGAGGALRKTACLDLYFLNICNWWRCDGSIVSVPGKPEHAAREYMKMSYSENTVKIGDWWWSELRCGYIIVWNKSVSGAAA